MRFVVFARCRFLSFPRSGVGMQTGDERINSGMGSHGGPWEPEKITLVPKHQLGNAYPQALLDEAG